jgi:hypothetical protein
MTDTTTPTKEQLEDAYAMTQTAEKALIVALEKAMTTFNNSVNKAVEALPETATASAAVAFSTRVKQSLMSISGYELTNLKTQYGLNEPLAVPTTTAP